MTDLSFLADLGLEGTLPGASTGADSWSTGGEQLVSINPATSQPIAAVASAQSADYERVIGASSG